MKKLGNKKIQKDTKTLSLNSNRKIIFLFIVLLIFLIGLTTIAAASTQNDTTSIQTATESSTSDITTPTTTNTTANQTSTSSNLYTSTQSTTTDTTTNTYIQEKNRNSSNNNVVTSVKKSTNNNTNIDNSNSITSNNNSDTTNNSNNSNTATINTDNSINLSTSSSTNNVTNTNNLNDNSSNKLNISNSANQTNTTVKQATSTASLSKIKITVNPIITTTGSTVTINGNITNNQGNLISGSNKIAIKINNKTIATNIYSVNGIINTKITIPNNYAAGAYTLTVVTGDTTTYYASKSNSLLMLINNTNSKITVKNWEQLNLVLSSSLSNGKTIVLQSGTYTASSPITIKYNTTLIGSGTVYYIYKSSTSNNAINIATKKTLTLKNITFKNSQLTKGSMIYVNSGAQLYINNCIFYNITSTYKSPAISNNGYTKIISSEFSKNIAQYGSGGAITNNNKLYLESSILNSNKALGNESSGGAIATKGTTTIRNSTINGNYATRYGGAVYNTGRLNIYNSYLTSNKAGIKGGAILNNKGNAYITYSIIKGNDNIDIYNSNGNVSCNYNWWSTNSKPTSDRVYNCYLKTWIYMKLTASNNIVDTPIKLSLSFNYYTDGNTIKSLTTSSIPVLPVKIKIDSNYVNKTYSGSTTNGTYAVTTTFTTQDTLKITGYTPSVTTKLNIVLKTNSSIYAGLFIQYSSSVTSSSVTNWVNAGITDVFVQANSTTTAQLRKVISLTSGTNIRVHAWVTCFHTSSGFDISTTRMNAVRSLISSLIKINGVDGICLDYVRYSGTDSSIVNVSKITNFVKSVYTLVKSYNSNLKVSACVFPEMSQTATYYGQSYSALSPYLDIMMPMAYKYDYSTTRAWIGKVVAYIAARSTHAAVVCALQTYKETSSGYTLLSSSELSQDIQTVLNNGGAGYALFRYGLISSYPTVTA